MASGSPSSRWQNSVTTGTSASVSSKSSALALARSTNSRTAPKESAAAASTPAVAGGVSSGGTRRTLSPSARSGSRLVASRRTPGAALQQLLREEGRSVSEVLAIVEHDQDLALAQVGEDARGRIVGRAGIRAEGGGERVRHQRSVGEGCEVDHADAVAERRPEPVGDRERQGRLADPARPDERDEAPALQAADDHVDERVPPDGPRDAVGQYRTVPRGRRRRLQHLGRERADEAVPASGHRRDVAGSLAVVAESASQRGDLRPEVALVDGDAGPGASDELVPRHHLARSLGECHRESRAPDSRAGRARRPSAAVADRARAGTART